MDSYINVGIHWNNHHHLFQVTQKTNGKILWSNLNLLFWLSNFPFLTGWMGNNHIQKHPVTIYDIVQLLATISFKILIKSIIKSEGKNSAVARAYKKDLKGTVSIILYSIAVILSFWYPIFSIGLYIVAFIWFFLIAG